jgi:hypothetical protein
MTSRLRSESGWAVVTAMLVMAVMLSVGLALYSLADGQTGAAATEHNNESTFDYAQSLLDSEAYIISANWPATSGILPDCAFDGATVVASGGNTNTNLCPSPTQLAQTFTTKDYSGTVTWTVRVRDNGGTDQCVPNGAFVCSYFYDDTALATQPAYDWNGDNQVWIRAQAIYRGQRHTVVERVALDRQGVQFPASAITAGHLTIKDSPHIKVVTNYTPINLRCDQNTAGCLVYKKSKQIEPYKITFNYPGTNAIDPTLLDQLRTRAKAENSYYSTCPNKPPGSFIFVESGTCKYTAMPATSASKQGVYIQASGTLTIDTPGKNADFYGLVYMANGCATCAHLTGDVLTIKNGRRTVRGIVAVDYGGGVNVGGSKGTQVIYDPVALDGLYLYYGSTILRPSFREIATSTP